MDRKSKTQVQPRDVSSGEAELISLGIECLAFERERTHGKVNILLIDEPDVHLHPDLQARFAHFVEQIVSDDCIFLIATHSTALLGALSGDAETRVAFMRSGEMELGFERIDEVHRQVLPVFGAHPLSNVFNEAPVLLVEGEDDERIWQQAVRSSQRKIRVYPVAVDGVGELAPYEQQVNRILEAVYDDAIGYSLRDRDTDPGELPDVGRVRRMRLACRAAENLLLADDCLSRLNTTWDEMQGRIDAAVNEGWKGHPHHGALKAFADSGYERFNWDLKEIRNDLMGLASSSKPWEVLVGQSIASMKLVGDADAPQGSLQRFLGPKVCQALLRAPDKVA